MKALNGLVIIDYNEDMISKDTDSWTTDNPQPVRFNGATRGAIAKVLSASNDTILPTGEYAKALVEEGDWIYFDANQLHCINAPNKNKGIAYVPHRYVLAKFDNEAEALEYYKEFDILFT